MNLRSGYAELDILSLKRSNPMKTKNNQQKEFDTIKMTRAIKAKISREIRGMNIEELQAYLAENSAKLYSGS